VKQREAQAKTDAYFMQTVPAGTYYRNPHIICMPAGRSPAMRLCAACTLGQKANSKTPARTKLAGRRLEIIAVCASASCLESWICRPKRQLVRSAVSVEPEALARIAGRSVTFAALAGRMRCSQCGKKGAEVVAVARPRPRGGGRREG
jgi:hypothetical protein